MMQYKFTKTDEEKKMEANAMRHGAIQGINFDELLPNEMGGVETHIPISVEKVGLFANATNQKYIQQWQIGIKPIVLTQIISDCKDFMGRYGYDVNLNYKFKLTGRYKRPDGAEFDEYIIVIKNPLAFTSIAEFIMLPEQQKSFDEDVINCILCDNEHVVGFSFYTEPKTYLVTASRGVGLIEFTNGRELVLLYRYHEKDALDCLELRHAYAFQNVGTNKTPGADLVADELKEMKRDAAIVEDVCHIAVFLAVAESLYTMCHQEKRFVSDTHKKVNLNYDIDASFLNAKWFSDDKRKMKSADRVKALLSHRIISRIQKKMGLRIPLKECSMKMVSLCSDYMINPLDRTNWASKAMPTYRTYKEMVDDGFRE